MAEHRHLSNAPIAEAIIDLRVKLPPGFQVKELSPLKETLHDRYPNAKERRLFAGELGVEAGKPFAKPPEAKGIDGYVFKSADNKSVVQFNKAGFTFSRLRPYTCWEAVLSEAKALWEIYVSKTSPELVTRIATRYINQLNIPFPISDFAQYLTAPPNIPDTLPQAVSHFLTRVVIHDTEPDITANITQALEKTPASPASDHITIILDIDVFKHKEGGFSESDIWSTFEQLRDLKNRIFFDSITEKTARLYE